MKKQSLILISFIFLLNTFSHSTEINAAIGKAKVIDGDTIVINGEKIRFGGGVNKKRRRRSKNTTRKMSMKGKITVKKTTRKKKIR